LDEAFGLEFMSLIGLSLKKTFFLKNVTLNWQRKQNKNMFCQNYQNVNISMLSFYLWISQGAHDIFAVVINFLGVN
jgi:competence CoiA-like predicted nuclease